MSKYQLYVYCEVHVLSLDMIMKEQYDVLTFIIQNNDYSYISNNESNKLNKVDSLAELSHS